MAAQKNRTNRADASRLYRLAGLGIELVAAVIGGCVIGWLIDRQFGTRYGLLIGAVLGIVGGMYNLLRQALDLVRHEQRSSGKERDPANGDD